MLLNITTIDGFSYNYKNRIRDGYVYHHLLSQEDEYLAPVLINLYAWCVSLLFVEPIIYIQSMFRYANGMDKSVEKMETYTL
jgi:hypothetical protein